MMIMNVKDPLERIYHVLNLEKLIHDQCIMYDFLRN